MASTIISKEEFIDYMMMLLLEKLLHPDSVMPNYELFNDITDTMSSRGIRQLLLFYYVNTDATIRSKFKSSKKVFKEGSMESLNIVAKGKVEGDEPENTSTVKALIKKALKVVAEQKRKSGFPLNEEKIDRILDKLLEGERFIIETKR